MGRELVAVDPEKAIQGALDASTQAGQSASQPGEFCVRQLPQGANERTLGGVEDVLMRLLVQCNTARQTQTGQGTDQERRGQGALRTANTPAAPSKVTNPTISQFYRNCFTDVVGCGQYPKDMGYPASTRQAVSHHHRLRGEPEGGFVDGGSPPGYPIRLKQGWSSTALSSPDGRFLFGVRAVVGHAAILAVQLHQLGSDQSIF
ncbi:hypothetical protein ACFWBH_03515 [Streptomyces sp. NPDC059999]|uniref:hypothetical protein n=1 Tax=Streptomyces sp. NPDC059999 TaxID=3347030 RepID=UPI0036A87D0E